MLRDPTSRVAHASRASTAVVLTVLPRLWMTSLEVVRMFASHLRSPAVFPRIRVPAATSASSTTSTPTTEAVLVSGTAAVRAMTTVSRLKPNAKNRARTTLASTSVYCPRALASVKAIPGNGTSTRTAIAARNSNTVDAMELTIASTAWSSARAPARSPTVYVSCRL